jgi:hypothetical protein
LLPCEILQRAWRIHGRHWIDLAEHRESGFRTVLAPNKGYQTESVAVPIPVLLKALTEDAMLIEWGQPDDDTQPQLPLPLATATGQLFLNFGGKN